MVIKLLITKRDELVLTENAPAEVQVVGTRCVLEKSSGVTLFIKIFLNLFIEEKEKILVQYFNEVWQMLPMSFYPSNPVQFFKRVTYT